MSNLATIFTQYGAEYKEKYGSKMLPSHHAVMRAVTACRTEQLGGSLYHCESCDQPHYSYHSCQNRHCPQCQTNKGQEWLDKQTNLLIPGNYHLITFTVPAALRALIRAHQKTLYSLLFQASAQATQQLAQNPKWVGGKIGMVGVLHTWGRQLIYHPHIHYLVPAGYLTTAGKWQTTPSNFFLPVRALSRVFRAKFRDGLSQTDWFDEIPPEVWSQNWVVHAKPVGNGQAALKYLAPYIFRVAISNNRISRLSAGQVTFRFRQSDTGTWRTSTIPVLEFIRRFLQHTLPYGFVKVRYYGLFSPTNRALLAELRQTIAPATSPEPDAILPQLTPLPRPHEPHLLCPRCKQPLSFQRRLLPMSRPPPHSLKPSFHTA